MPWQISQKNKINDQSINIAKQILVEFKKIKFKQLALRGISNIVWSVCILHIRDVEMMNRLAVVILDKLNNHLRINHGGFVVEKNGCGPQSFSNIIWSYAILHFPIPELFDKIGEAAMPVLEHYNPQNLSNTLFAYASANILNEPFITALVKVAVKKMPSFSCGSSGNCRCLCQAQFSRCKIYAIFGRYRKNTTRAQ